MRVIVIMLLLLGFVQNPIRLLTVRAAILSLLLIFGLGTSNAAYAGGTEVFEVKIIIKDHKFIPDVVKVPAFTKIRLTVENHDPTIEEFESIDLKREKIIPGGEKTNIILAPLKPGNYKFFGEFHEETAQGILLVEEMPAVPPVSD